MALGGLTPQFWCSSVRGAADDGMECSQVMEIELQGQWETWQGAALFQKEGKVNECIRQSPKPPSFQFGSTSSPMHQLRVL